MSPTLLTLCEDTHSRRYSTGSEVKTKPLAPLLPVIVDLVPHDHQSSDPPSATKLIQQHFCTGITDNQQLSGCFADSFIYMFFENRISKGVKFWNGIFLKIVGMNLTDSDGFEYDFEVINEFQLCVFGNVRDIYNAEV